MRCDAVLYMYPSDGWLVRHYVEGLCKNLSVSEEEARDLIKLGVWLVKEACHEYTIENPTSIWFSGTI